MNTICTSVALFLLCALIVLKRIQVKRYKEKHKVEAEATYQRLSIKSDDPHLSFTPSSAQAMSTEEIVDEMRGAILAYTLKRISRNEHGEYFWFRFRTDSPPILKHIDQINARILLKKKYVSPS